jgi:hypothetical protein
VVLTIKDDRELVIQVHFPSQERWADLHVLPPSTSVEYGLIQRDRLNEDDDEYTHRLIERVTRVTEEVQD